MTNVAEPVSDWESLDKKVDVSKKKIQLPVIYYVTQLR